MTKQEIKQVLDEVQARLDGLQGEGASFLFIGHEGNNFTLSGSPLMLTAQLIFAMMRYPIVRDIIKACADKYDELNKEHGQAAREVVMSHLIEKYKAQMEDILTKREVSFTYEPSHKSATHFISKDDAERVRQDIINNPNKYRKLDL